MMKKKILLLFSILAMAVSASAYTFEVDGIYYNTLSGTSVEVTSGGSNYTDNVVIPSSVTYGTVQYSVKMIGECAFKNCSGLTSVTIPNTVIEISVSAFEGCSGLTSIVIPSSVSMINTWAFMNCSNLKEITSLATTPPELSGQDWFMSVPNSCKLIVPNATAVEAYKGATGWSAFSTNILYANQVIRYTASAKVEPNVSDVFGANYNSESSTFANGQGILVFSGDVTSIGRNAFYNCSSLTSVTIGNSVATIGEHAFEGCAGLTSVEIPNSVTTIGRNAFNNCTALTSITIPDGVTSIGSSAFSGTALYEDNKNWEDNVLYIGNHLIKANNISGEYKTKDGTLTIADQAFYSCNSLTSVEIPNSVTSIGEYAFYYCTGLTSVEIPNSVTSIGDWAFEGCKGLTSVEIPNSVITIGNSAFYYCTALTSVTIPNSVTSIGGVAFACCTNLAEITSLATTPPTIGTGVFSSIASTYTIKVPNISVSAYQGATNWITYKENISALDRSYGVTISSAELATLWLEYDATVPANAEVYYAKDFDNVASTVKMTKITGKVLPRETGVIVKGTAGTYTFNEAGTEGEKVSSMLVGSATEKTFEESGYRFYKLTYLTSIETDFGFYLDNSNGTIVTTPHRAYLKLSTGGGAGAPTRGIGIEWGDEGTTEIESVVDFDIDNSTMYNLQGMPVGKDYKGIVIKNGRKMLNK